MASARLIVDTALKKLGVVGAGRSARPSDATDCLAVLQGLYNAWIASGAFGRLEDIIPTGNTFTATGNQRIVRASADTLSVSLPEYVSEGWVADYGKERRGGYYGTIITITDEGDQTVVDVQTAQPMGYATTPRDGSPVVISDQTTGISQSWLYDGHAKKWQAIDNFTLEDEAPRSLADPQGLASVLAIEVADLFNRDVPQMTLAQANRYLTAMTVGYGMRRETTFQPGAYI